VFNSAATAEGFRPASDVRDAILHVASGYLDAHEKLAQVQVVNAVQSWLSDAEKSGVKTDVETVLGGELAELFSKITANVNRVVQTEVTRAGNAGTLDVVTKIATASGVDDPYVYFAGPNDQHTCEECDRLFFLADGTPKVYRLSEVGHGYHKKGENSPKIGGCHPNCFTADTRLHTQYGMLTVKELFERGESIRAVVDSRIKVRRVGGNQFGVEIPGETWLDRHASGSQIRSATAVFDTGIQDCVRLQFEHGIEIELSNDHEIWVDDDTGGRRVRAVDITPGQKVPLLSGEGLWGDDTFPELAELMGNLTGDGVNNETSKTSYWNFFGNDIPYGNKLLDLARQYCSKHLLETLTIIPPDDRYNVPRAVFNSPKLFGIFKEDFGFSKRPRRVPRRIWGADKKTVSAYLRGLYAADGHSQGSPSVVLAQNDREFLQEIQLLLSNFGLRSGLYEHGDACIKPMTDPIGRVRDVERKPCWRLIIGGYSQVAKFATDIGLGVPSKQEALVRRLEAASYNNKLGAWRTDRVLTVTPTGAKQTYCLTEPVTNTVTANGLVVGQCRHTMVYIAKGYGFRSGKLTFIGLDHDELEIQRA
jgi:hypothetical protein